MEKKTKVCLFIFLLLFTISNYCNRCWEKKKTFEECRNRVLSGEIRSESVLVKLCKNLETGQFEKARIFSNGTTILNYENIEQILDGMYSVRECFEMNRLCCQQEICFGFDNGRKNVTIIIGNKTKLSLEESTLVFRILFRVPFNTNSTYLS